MSCLHSEASIENVGPRVVGCLVLPGIRQKVSASNMIIIALNNSFREGGGNIRLWSSPHVRNSRNGLGGLPSARESAHEYVEVMLVIVVVREKKQEQQAPH